MFKMYVKLDNSRLKADGLMSKNDELIEIVRSVDSYAVDHTTKDADGNTEHEFSTSSFGDESYLITLLEETPWFMKYVLSWTTDDNGYLSDMIEVEREMGLM